MALNIKNPEVNRLAREVADRTGETITEAVEVALSERLARLRQAHGVEQLLQEVERVQAFVRSLPDRDRRSADEILGYDEFGLPR